MLLVLAYMANLVLDLIGWLAHPGPVAVHFSAGGQADAWGSSGGQALTMAALQTLLFAVFFTASRWVVLVPVRWVNLPHREYWLAPAHRDRCAEKIRERMHRFGSVLLLFFLAIGALALQAQERQPPCLDQRLFFTALGLFLGYTAAWSVSFWRTFRVPPP
jgi:hypothetical protein